MADFKIFKISMLASSAIIAPIGTILVQNEYADLDEEEPKEKDELDDSEDEELEEPTIVTVRSQREELQKRREKYRGNPKFEEFLQERRDIVIAERTRNGLPILRPVEVVDPTQLVTEIPSVTQPAPESTPAPQPRTGNLADNRSESQVVEQRVSTNNPSNRQVSGGRGSKNVLSQRVGPNHSSRPQAVLRRGPNGQLIGPKGQLVSRVAVFKKGQRPMAKGGQRAPGRNFPRIVQGAGGRHLRGRVPNRPQQNSHSGN